MPIKKQFGTKSAIIIFVWNVAKGLLRKSTFACETVAVRKSSAAKIVVLCSGLRNNMSHQSFSQIKEKLQLQLAELQEEIDLVKYDIEQAYTNIIVLKKIIEMNNNNLLFLKQEAAIVSLDIYKKIKERNVMLLQQLDQEKIELEKNQAELKKIIDRSNMIKEKLNNCTPKLLLFQKHEQKT